MWSSALSLMCLDGKKYTVFWAYLLGSLMYYSSIVFSMPLILGLFDSIRMSSTISTIPFLVLFIAFLWRMLSLLSLYGFGFLNSYSLSIPSSVSRLSNYFISLMFPPVVHVMFMIASLSFCPRMLFSMRSCILESSFIKFPLSICTNCPSCTTFLVSRVGCDGSSLFKFFYFACFHS